MNSASETPALPVPTRVLIGAFGVSGVVHLVRPKVFYPLIPPALGSPRLWTYGSGAAELVCAGGLATQSPWAPRLSAALLAGIWVGNIWMAVRETRRSPRRPPLLVAAWLRVPLQLPMIRWALASPTR